MRQETRQTQQEGRDAKVVGGGVSNPLIQYPTFNIGEKRDRERGRSTARGRRGGRLPKDRPLF